MAATREKLPRHSTKTKARIELWRPEPTPFVEGDIKMDDKSPFKAGFAHRGLGRPTVFQNPEEVEIAFSKYVEWNDANPMIEKRLVSYQGDSELIDVPKLRVMTLHSMQTFLGISDTLWMDLRKREGFEDVCKRIQERIKNQKFEGAASGFFNANFIARDLEMVDKQEVTTKEAPASGDAAAATSRNNLLKLAGEE